MLQLHATKREAFKKKANSLRNEGKIPGEVYGHGFENQHIAVSAKDFMQVFKQAGESSVITLQIDKQSVPVIIHEVDRDAVSGDVHHVDFHVVRMDEKIAAEVPLHIVGEATGVREKGGILIHSLDKLRVEALPADLPSHFDVDVTFLADVGQSIYVSDIKIPKGIEVLTEPETPVASLIQKAAEEPAPAPAAETEEAAEGEEGEAPAEGAEEEEKKEE
jgi:large subunit ribosomal protein L25